MPVTWERRAPDLAPPSAHRDLARVQVTPCYDFLFSLGALFNTRMFESARVWARTARAALRPDTLDRGRFFFKGNQGLGYGAARLIADLPDHAPPERLIQAVRESDPSTLALYVVDTGETSEEQLAAIRVYLQRPGRRVGLDHLLSGLTVDWAQRCRRVLQDPTAVRAEFTTLLEEYHGAVFSSEVEQLIQPLELAGNQARDLLSVLPATDAIERLSGGYTLARDLPLQRVTVAPSVFIYPFMFSRVDMAAGEALIAYGVATDLLRKPDPAPPDPQLARVVHALADPNRQKLVQLLARKPMYGPELVAALGLSQPTVHHHLAQLRAASLVRQERGSGGMRYTLRQDTASRTVDALRDLFASA